MSRIHSLCWWLTSNSHAFVDAHAADGELVRFGIDEPGSITFPEQPDKGAAREAAKFLVHHIAQFFGVEEVVHDTDSEADFYEPEEA